jgi:hypothetical protein
MMRRLITIATISVLFTGATMAQETIQISSPWGDLTAQLADNASSDALLEMLPLTIDMRDHLRQEKTGNLPASLPEARRQLAFENGTLGLWGPDDFVIYYRNGRVPSPGIIILGRIQGDASILDRDGPVTVELKRSE